MRLILLRLGLGAFVSLLTVGVILRGAEPVLQVDDATIQVTDDGWIIGNASIRYSIGPAGGAFVVQAIQDPVSGRDWHRANAPDAVVGVNGQLVGIGSPASSFVRAEAREWFGGVRLDLSYRLPSASLDVMRSYVCYPGSAVIESWTTFQADGAGARLSDLGGVELSVQNGTLNWVTGLGTPDDQGGAFTRASGELDDGQAFYLGSEGRASEQAVPWFTVRADDQEFFGSILWSGSWRLRVARQGERLQINLGLPSFETALAPGASLETPHVIFGMTSVALPDTAAALRGFIEKGLRRGRPFGSYVTYNTWYSRGTFIDEPSVLTEMEMAASIGVEAFVLDAGWWTGASQNDAGDFTRQWGNWQVDLDRFPNGLAALSVRAHELGMRFGVWVEPERVDLATVGMPGLAKEQYLASSRVRSEARSSAAGTRKARPRNARPSVTNVPEPAAATESAQICLVDRDAHAWVLDKLLRFIDEARPDYIKWDNNFWINCTRSSHGHGTGDGNFLHHRALQQLLDQVREIYPDLEIENCASGGNRLSLDMLARTDAAWLDDRTAPSARVRHAIEGLVGWLPTPYLLSFSITPIEGPDETRFDSLSYVLRSRMLGIPGMSWGLTGMEDPVRRVLTLDIELYKRLRPIQQHGTAILLAPQVRTEAWSGWDAVEYIVPGGAQAAVVAFNTFDAPASAAIRMKGLRPDAVYQVDSADAGLLGSVTGRDLMEIGIEMQASDNARGHVIFIRLE